MSSFIAMASEFGFRSDYEVEGFCIAGDLEDRRWGVLLCALAEKGSTAAVMRVAEARLAEAIRSSKNDGNAAHMVGSALLLLGSATIDFVERVYKTGGLPEKKWAAAQLGFYRQSKAALDTLISWFNTSEGEVREVIIAALGQIRLAKASWFILQNAPMLSDEERMTAAFSIMGGAIEPRMKPALLQWQTNEANAAVSARLAIALRRCGN